MFSWGFPPPPPPPSLAVLSDDGSRHAENRRAMSETTFDALNRKYRSPIASFKPIGPTVL